MDPQNFYMQKKVMKCATDSNPWLHKQSAGLSSTTLLQEFKSHPSPHQGYFSITGVSRRTPQLSEISSKWYFNITPEKRGAFIFNILSQVNNRRAELSSVKEYHEKCLSFELVTTQTNCRAIAYYTGIAVYKSPLFSPWTFSVSRDFKDYFTALRSFMEKTF